MINITLHRARSILAVRRTPFYWVVTTPSGSEESTVNVRGRKARRGAHTNIRNRPVVCGGLSQQCECFRRNLCGKPVEHGPIFMRHHAVYDIADGL